MIDIYLCRYDEAHHYCPRSCVFNIRHWVGLKLLLANLEVVNYVSYTRLKDTYSVDHIIGKTGWGVEGCYSKGSAY